MALPGQNLVVGQQPFQLPNGNPGDNQSTLVLNQDTTFSIDLAPDDTFSFTNTYTLDPQEGINWPQGGSLYARISPGQTTNGVIVWVQPGGTVAPPHAISVSGGVNAQALQGYPISATPPSTNQGLVWNGNTWVPANLVNSVSAGTGISVSGSTGNVTIGNTGVTSLAAGSNISLSGSTGAVTINATSAAAQKVWIQVGTDIAISLTAFTNILTIGPFAVGVTFFVVGTITYTNTGGLSAANGYIFYGSSSGPAGLMASASEELNTSYWGSISLVGIHQVSGSSDNYAWLCGKGQTGGGGVFLAKAANQDGNGGATTFAAIW